MASAFLGLLHEEYPKNPMANLRHYPEFHIMSRQFDSFDSSLHGKLMGRYRAIGLSTMLNYKTSCFSRKFFTFLISSLE